MTSKQHRTHTPNVTGGGGGGGSTTFNQYVMFAEKVGPSSYATGGFVIDLSSTYASLNSLRLCIKKGTRGNVPFGRFDVDLDSPTAGKATIIVRGYNQTKVSSFDAVTGQPSGVTVQTVAGQVVSSEAAHTHSVDVPSMVVTTGAGTSHNHVDNSLYAHTHLLTHTVTNVGETQLTAGTDLSATTFYVAASGVRG